MILVDKKNYFLLFLLILTYYVKNQILYYLNVILLTSLHLTFHWYHGKIN
jgi:hypothetical protein